MTITTYFLYGCVRRRRISVPPRKLSSLRYDYEKLTDTSMEEEDIEAGGLDPVPQDRLKSVPEGIPPRTLADKYSKFIDFDGLCVHYRHFEAKGSRRPALVLLHGFGGSVFSWKKAWGDLTSKSKRSVLAFDLPGFGLTSRPTEGEWEHNPYTQRYSLMLLFKLMDSLGIERATFIGHGSGGALSVLAGAMRPKRVEMLILVSPAIYTSGFPTFIQSLFRTRLGKSIVTELVRSEMGELVLRRSYYNKKKLSEETLQVYKNLLKVQNWDDALWEMARVQPAVKVETKLSLVECPINIIHGENDKLIPYSESKRLLATMERHGQRCELRGLQKCGHVPHEEHPIEFVELVTDFLNDDSLELESKLNDP
eukprot:CAMPEP_0184492420 /NCGR_PEP_ID=MMETSP0113_2-20130426/23179_1 /TAXON_ID=91329 /ORGANISM="Norrisiella sphaerica, Strain BC52" /LENGTH=366 /DNA_ID=CAMNT_0026877213 /DNA_START=574 /DNA_END=1674 /DNA_ORIENTATION=+